MQVPTRRTWPRRLNEDVLSVVGTEVVSGVSAEDPSLGVDEAPVCADGEDLACGVGV